MNFPFFKSLLKKNANTLKLPESLLLKQLKSTATDNKINIFENITIYHHTHNFFIPLLLLDNTRGIFLFEYKEWSYNDLKDSKIERATQQKSSSNNLSFEKSQDFIKQKFKELTHTEGVPIFKYLLMPNLSTDEYHNLNDSIKELLPESKIMFSDSSQNTMLGKIMATEVSKEKLPSVPEIMGTLLIQYCILNENKEINLASSEQMRFIDSPLEDLTKLVAPCGSGRTSSILLKAILEKLKNPKLHISIIKPTKLACDILNKKLLDTIEYAIVEVNIIDFDILTPEKFLSKNIKKNSLIICDDAQTYSKEFIQKISNLKFPKIIVENSNDIYGELLFTKNFKNNNNVFHKANPHAKALQIISKLTQDNDAKDILVVSSSLSKEKLKDDMKFFIEDEAVLLDSSKNLIEQSLDNMLLASYEDIYGIDVKYVILMDICFVDYEVLKYANNIAKDTTYILYEDECDNLTLIRNNFESDKKRTGVESTT